MPIPLTENMKVRGWRNIHNYNHNHDDDDHHNNNINNRNTSSTNNNNYIMPCASPVCADMTSRAPWLTSQQLLIHTCKDDVMLHVTRSRGTRHTEQRNTSHVTRQTSHVTRHTSHVSRLAAAIWSRASVAPKCLQNKYETTLVSECNNTAFL